MPLRLLLTLVLMSFSTIAIAQDDALLDASTIPLDLKIKANAVIRYDQVTIEVKSYDKFIYKQTQIVTVLNAQGDSKPGTYVHYNKNIDVNSLEARVYDSRGEEIKKIRKNDFLDVSAVSGGTLYSDSRVKYLDYTPINYPYTIRFETEVVYHSTAFLPSWMPIDGFYCSTEFSEYKIINESDVAIKVKSSNVDDFNIEQHSDYHFSAKNLKSLKPEAYSPSFQTFAPKVKVALTKFRMEGVDGANNTWEDFGKWVHDELLAKTEVLPIEVITEVKELTKDATTDYDKAKLVYEYMQNKTRYISVQVGIGGWKPMLAGEVDRLGYADCKGLSNYTKALLKEIGVESNYAIIYGDRGIRNIDKEFSSVEGNHAVLCIPNDEKDIWLECTSQTNPFGFTAGFTDDRDALLITSEGGKIVHTTVYPTETNLQDTKATINLTNNGSISADVVIKTYGYQYALHEGVQNKPLRDQKLNLKEYWDYINGLSVDAIVYDNDKDNVVFTETAKVTSSSYATKSGKRFLVQPNAFNRVTGIPTRYKNRTLDFEIDRGFTDTDEFIIKIDPTLKIEAMPDDVSISNAYGSYQFSLEKISENELLYKRKYVLNKGYYPKEDYKAFRAFISQIVKHDKTKIVLISKT
ncbi:DUF3857 domain-containing protein [Psychroserpens algicola]|uniref:DUF3857 domain-containing protein n=1 Tax=Psychroserpens algicola TaxID=1719034 RepID=A0ABT0H903_9FLAO|nr:DUF3857 domain-containing protein [Psychroserpens algicola]MCK8480845.1 DUF3857 domain-containing protein [Psychroserpens algicola]